MIDVEIDARGVEALIQRLRLRGFTKAVATALLRTAQDLEGAISNEVKERLTKRPRGALARSWRSTLTERDGELVARVASALPYAAIQDQGGTIRPKRKYLAVPINLPGGPRPGQGPRQFGRPLRYVPTARGASLVETRGTGKRAKTITRYVLRRSVTLTGVGYLDAAVRQVDPEGRIGVVLDREIMREVDRAE